MKKLLLASTLILSALSAPALAFDEAACATLAKDAAVESIAALAGTNQFQLEKYTLQGTVSNPANKATKWAVFQYYSMVQRTTYRTRVYMNTDYCVPYGVETIQWAPDD